MTARVPVDSMCRPEAGDEQGWQGGEEESNARYACARKTTAEEAVEQEAGERQKRDEPEEVFGIHVVFCRLLVSSSSG